MKKKALPKLTENKLLDYYYSLEPDKKNDFIYLIVKECSISRMTAYRWLNDGSKVKAIYREKISEIANKTVNQLFNIK
jgi:hypothetical protein